MKEKKERIERNKKENRFNYGWGISEWMTVFIKS